MKFDSYTLIARIFPAILISPPFFALHYFLLSPYLGKFWGDLLGIKFISDITFSIVLLYFLSQLSRILAKEIFEKKIYNDGLNFPTTDFLLHMDAHFSSEYKNRIHEKIRVDFKVIIPSRRQEIQNEGKSRKCILEGMNHIRFKVGKGNLVGQHNSEYGFVRNLAGGSIVAVIISFINIIIFTWNYPNITATVISCVTFLIFTLFFFFSKKIISLAGLNYARVLLQEYMAK